MFAITGSLVTGVFDDRKSAWYAIKELRRAGFRDTEVGMIAGASGGNLHSLIDPVPFADEEKVEGVQGSSTGANFGAGLGVAALTLAAFTVPAVGPVVAGGFLAQLALGAVGGAVAGGLIGSLVGLGVPERHAREMELALLVGCTVVNVHAESRPEEAAEILDRHGARRIAPSRATEMAATR